LIGVERPIAFGVEPDTSSLDEDEAGSSSQLQRLFLELEMGEDEIVSFYDEDREPVYIKSAEVLIVELPLVCCEPSLSDAQIEGQTEDDEAEKVLPRSTKAR
jgi:hypothetical protein